jgi:hypothetical protein
MPSPLERAEAEVKRLREENELLWKGAKMRGRPAERTVREQAIREVIAFLREHEANVSPSSYFPAEVVYHHFFPHGDA